MAKMEIFVSWSGHKSHAIAETLREWLPLVVNAFDPWLSSEDIPAGTRWSPSIANRLASSRAGIICLTRNNFAAPWLLFEAGAISKTVKEDTFVIPLFIDVSQSEVTGPLSQFQGKNANKREDMLALVKTLNNRLEEGRIAETQLPKIFDKWWPDFESKLADLPSEDEDAAKPRREDREMIEELLGLVRQMSQTVVSSRDMLDTRLMGIESRIGYPTIGYPILNYPTAKGVYSFGLGDLDPSRSYSEILAKTNFENAPSEILAKTNLETNAPKKAEEADSNLGKRVTTIAESIKK